MNIRTIASGENRPVPLLAIILAIGMSLRLFQLGTHSLWLDESASVGLAASAPAQILGNPNGAHPPFYYLLLHFWLGLGQSEFTIRLLSVILGVLSIPLAYALARLWLAERVAVLASLLLAISPLHILYSQEARMYSLLTFLGLLSALSLSLVVKKGNPVWWLTYLLSSLAGLYTHYGMLPLLFAENLCLAAWWATHGRKPGFPIRWLSCHVALVLGFLPWMPVLIENLGGQAGIDAFAVSRLESLWSVGMAVPLVGGIAMLGVLAAAVMLALKTPIPLARLKGIGLRLAALVLYLLLTISAAFSQGASVKRQMVVLLPYVFFAAAFSLMKLQRGRNLLIAALVVLTCLSVPAGYAQREIEDWRDVASLVEASGQSGDVVLLHAFYTIVPFEHYYQGAIPRIGIAPQNQPVQLAAIQAQFQRAWVILSHDTYQDPDGKVLEWLTEHWTMMKAWNFAGVEVRLYHMADVASSEGSQVSLQEQKP